MNKKILIFIILIITSIMSLGLYTYVNRANNYKNMICTAENMQKQGEFNKAEQLYNDSLKIKHNNSVVAKIDSIKKSKDNLKQLEQVDLLVKENKYKDALTLLDSLSDDSIFILDKINNEKNTVKKAKEDYEALLEKQRKEREDQIAEEKRIQAEAEKQSNIANAKNEKFNSSKKTQSNNIVTKPKNAQKKSSEKINITIPDPSEFEKIREENRRRVMEEMQERNKKAME